MEKILKALVPYLDKIQEYTKTFIILVFVATLAFLLSKLSFEVDSDNTLIIWLSSINTLLIIILAFVKPKVKSKEFRNIQEIRLRVEDLLKSSKKNSKIVQTYVKNNLIASSNDDLIDCVIKKIEDEKLRPMVNRIFVIFDPWDINFAYHSKELSTGINFFEQKYGDNLTNYFLCSNNIQHDNYFIPNITIVDKKCLISFPKRLKTDRIKYPKKLVHRHNETTTTGIELNDSALTKKYQEFYGNIISMDIEEIKTNFWFKDGLSYLYSVVYSLAKELYSFNNLKNNIKYLGLVGSVAREIEKETKLGEIDFKVENCNDLDLLIILENGNCKDTIESIFNIADDVCRRFSIDNVINFFTHKISTPIKSASIINSKINMPVHLLIADSRHFEKWDKYITIDRMAFNTTFTWVNSNNKSKNRELNDFFEYDNFILTDLLNGVYGLKNSILILKENKSILYKEWDLTKKEINKKEYEKSLQNMEKSMYAKYALKWCTINFCNAKDNKTVSNGEYISDYNTALTKIDKIIGSNQTSLLMEIYNKPVEFIDDNDISIITDSLEKLLDVAENQNNYAQHFV